MSHVRGGANDGKETSISTAAPCCSCWVGVVGGRVGVNLVKGRHLGQPAHRFPVLSATAIAVTWLLELSVCWFRTANWVIYIGMKKPLAMQGS